MADGHDVITLASGPAQTFGGSAGHPNRRMRLLHRSRIKRELIEAPKFTLVARAILAPCFKNHLQRFVQALPIVFPGDPENLVVHLGVARADAELKPAAGDRVDHRVILGAVERMAQRQDRNARTEMNFRSARGGCGKQHCRVGDRPAVAEKMVLVEHETFPAQLFSQRHLFKNLLVVDFVAVDRYPESRSSGC